jgi:hypothetical protein
MINDIRHNATMYTKYAVSYLLAKAEGEYVWADHFAGIARQYATHVVRDAGAFGEALLTHQYAEAGLVAQNDHVSGYDRAY